MRLTVSERGLIGAALLAKANDDRKAAATVRSHPDPTNERNAGLESLARTLDQQADQAEKLAERMEYGDEDTEFEGATP